MNQWRTAVLLAIVVGLVSVSAMAQTQWTEYSVKFLCGTIGPDLPPAAAALGQGIYNTSINIHNPQLPVPAGLKVTFGKLAIISNPEGVTPLPLTAFRVDTLQPFSGEEVDCRIIRSMLGAEDAKAPFIEGFVVLLVVPNPPPKQELDVVGVYTVANLQGQSISLEMEPAAPRFFTLPVATAAKMREKLSQQPKKP